MWLYVLFVVAIVIFLRFILSDDPPPIKNVYRLPGKWFPLKFYIFTLLLKLRERKNKTQSKGSNDQAGYGIKSRGSVSEMDRVQPLPVDKPQAVDAVYINGSNKDGYYLVAATARRQSNLVQTLLYIRIPGVGLLELPSLPDTEHYTTDTESFTAAGLEIKVESPMELWNLKYNGNMRFIKSGEKDTSELVGVKFDLQWKACSKYFDFDTDMNSSSVCDAMAREPWSKDFFKRLKELHQTHYEQFGEISGTVHIEGHSDVELQLQGVRDHSYGNIRDWSQLHRYAIQYLHLENGTSIAVGLICMPKTLSRLVMGYVMHPSGAMDTVTSTDFEFWRHGDSGKPPKDLKFSFQAGNQNYNVTCQVLDDRVFYMGLDWEARIHERMCSFDVNGVKGWGISEWDYRNRTGRPELYNSTANKKAKDH